jgi:hypothetical protein
MPKRRRVVDHRGRTWTATKTARRDADAEDFRFWFEELSPAQRVLEVEAALEQCLKARGQRGVPRLRRVHRRFRRAAR